MYDRRDDLLDQLLALRCREGSRDALRLLVERWQERLWRHAYRLTRDADGAWDVLQDGWLAVADGIGRLEDPARLRAWLYAIVTRRAADHLRRRGRVEAAEAAGADFLREARSLDADGAGGDARSVVRLRHALRDLSGERRALLELAYLEGLGTDELAQVFGVPSGTIKSRLHYARRELRAILERTEP